MGRQLGKRIIYLLVWQINEPTYGRHFFHPFISATRCLICFTSDPWWPERRVSSRSHSNPPLHRGVWHFSPRKFWAGLASSTTHNPLPLLRPPWFDLFYEENFHFRVWRKGTLRLARRRATGRYHFLQKSAVIKSLPPIDTTTFVCRNNRFTNGDFLVKCEDFKNFVAHFETFRECFSIGEKSTKMS